MASDKTELSRAGTMQLTAQDGKLYLDKNLTDWKKPYLMDQFDNKSDSEESDEGTGSKAAKKPKMSKHTTMMGTVKEAAGVLGSNGPDEDVFTRGQQKALDEIKNEKPPTKKARMVRDNTMATTAKEGKALIGKEKFGSTRHASKQKKKQTIKRSSTIATVVAEAEKMYGSVDTSSSRKLRKRSAKPSPLKKVGTMQKTAKEGREFLKRKRTRK